MRLTSLLFHFYKNLMRGPFTWKPALVLRHPGNGNGGSCLQLRRHEKRKERGYRHQERGSLPQSGN